MDLPKLVITDIDGVWTDGGMYYDEQGNELKKFNTSDSAGVLFLKSLDIPMAIITGEDRMSVSRRAEKLGIPHVFKGISDKLPVATKLCTELGVTLDEVAYIGDDLGDMELLAHVAISGCPQNAPDYIKDLVHIVTQKSGGEGAFREFVETILIRAGRFDSLLKEYTHKKD